MRNIHKYPNRRTNDQNTQFEMNVTKAIVISGSSCFIYAPDSRPPPEHGDLITAGVGDNNGHNLRRGYI